ncbi:MAG: adventurous gliding motility TPR repeat lipoprotein GltE [Myxococcaceae bacterium]
MTSVSPRLLASALASLLATACATTAPAEKAPAAPVASQPKTDPGPTAASAPSAPNARAMLLFEDATKAADAQAKSGTRDDAALDRRFEAVRQADPTVAEADYNLGVLAERQGKRDQAYAFYLSALQKKPSFKAAAEGLARLTQAQGDVTAAIAQWNDIARAFPDDAGSRAQLAELYRLSGDHDRALEFARQALIRDPKNLDAYKTMLRSNLDRKQYAMAELVGVRALKISTTDPDLYLALGDVQLARGAMDKAAAQYQKALEANASFVPARLALAQLALRDEDFAAAEKQLSRAVADGGGSAEVHLDLGVAYRGLGQPDKALVEYDAAEKLQPKLAAIYLNRGIVLQRYKDAPEKSLELYKQYVALSGGESELPNDSSVLALRREAEQLVAAKSQARAQEQQSKTLDEAQKLQQQRLKDAEERAAKGTPAKATAPGTQKPPPEKL